MKNQSRGKADSLEMLLIVLNFAGCLVFILKPKIFIGSYPPVMNNRKPRKKIDFSPASLETIAEIGLFRIKKEIRVEAVQFPYFFQRTKHKSPADDIRFGRFCEHYLVLVILIQAPGSGE